MATYELDDDLVRAWLEGHPDGNLSGALRAQLPVPVPTKIGAVVRTEMDVRGPQVFIRWTAFSSPYPWMQVSDPSNTYTNDQIGRITEVLSEGIDL